MKSTDLKGLYVPLITPFYKGIFDKESFERLIDSIDSEVDGYIPCLSTGEGEKINKYLWEEILNILTSKTKKPIIMGVLQITEEMMEVVNKSNTDGVIIPSQKDNNKEFFQNISKNINKDIIIYNTSKFPIKKSEEIIELDKLNNIIGLKDSSMQKEFFKELLELKSKDKLQLSIFQGMEDELLSSNGCDGYIVSLANIEPKLCKEMLQEQTTTINTKIIDLFDKYKLGSTHWYEQLKIILYERQIINSPETIE